MRLKRGPLAAEGAITDKFDEYSDVMTRLVSETIACAPQEWTHGTLTMQSDGLRLDYKLKNESQPGTAVISEKLRDLIDELYVRMSRHGDTWSEAAVRFQQGGDDCKFNTSFKYSQRTKSSEEGSRKKPWWRFGSGA